MVSSKEKKSDNVICSDLRNPLEMSHILTCLVLLRFFLPRVWCGQRREIRGTRMNADRLVQRGPEFSASLW